MPLPLVILLFVLTSLTVTEQISAEVTLSAKERRQPYVDLIKEEQGRGVMEAELERLQNSEDPDKTLKTFQEIDAPALLAFVANEARLAVATRVNALARLTAVKRAMETTDDPAIRQQWSDALALVKPDIQKVLGKRKHSLMPLSGTAQVASVEKKGIVRFTQLKKDVQKELATEDSWIVDQEILEKYADTRVLVLPEGDMAEDRELPALIPALEDLVDLSLAAAEWEEAFYYEIQLADRYPPIEARFDKREEYCVLRIGGLHILTHEAYVKGVTREFFVPRWYGAIEPLSVAQRQRVLAYAEELLKTCACEAFGDEQGGEQSVRQIVLGSVSQQLKEEEMRAFLAFSENQKDPFLSSDILRYIEGKANQDLNDLLDETKRIRGTLGNDHQRIVEDEGELAQALAEIPESFSTKSYIDQLQQEIAAYHREEASQKKRLLEVGEKIKQHAEHYAPDRAEKIRLGKTFGNLKPDAWLEGPCQAAWKIPVSAHP